MKQIRHFNVVVDIGGHIVRTSVYTADTDRALVERIAKVKASKMLRQRTRLPTTLLPARVVHISDGGPCRERSPDLFIPSVYVDQGGVMSDQ